MNSHYKIYGYEGQLLYFFTTTQRNLEDCLNIIVERFKNRQFYKVDLNGEIVFIKTIKHPKKVIDKKTGKIYKNSQQLSKALNKKYGTVRHMLTQSSNNTRYIYYEN